MAGRESKRRRIDEESASEGEVGNDTTTDSVISAFEAFERAELELARRVLTNAANIPRRLKRLLPAGEIDRQIAGFEKSARQNAAFVNAVLAHAQRAGFCEGYEADAGDDGGNAAELCELRAVLHSAVREWSDEGRTERQECMAAVITELRHCLPSVTTSPKKRVLVQGAGLCRLPAEICAAGYEVQANEMSWHMILVANFLLNACRNANTWSLCPFVHQRGNHCCPGDQLRAITLPDVTPSTLLAGGCFSMAPGEFLETYASDDDTEAWDAVVTCWFVDTAPCALEYVETIQRLLKPGGHWINFGPLLFHWAEPDDDEDAQDVRFARSLELSWTSLRHAIARAGFTFQREEWRETSYTENVRSMMQTRYKCMFFTATRNAAVS